jgi:hypothetical protein
MWITEERLFFYIFTRPRFSRQQHCHWRSGVAPEPCRQGNGGTRAPGRRLHGRGRFARERRDFGVGSIRAPFAGIGLGQGRAAAGQKRDGLELHRHLKRRVSCNSVKIRGSCTASRATTDSGTAGTTTNHSRVQLVRDSGASVTCLQGGLFAKNP